MSKLLLSTGLFLTTLFSSSLGCIKEDFIISKRTWASSNSERDYAWALDITPGIEDQVASKFKQGQCGYQSKLVLEESCFKVHHPTTWQHEQYQTRVSEIETVFSKKIASLTSSNPSNNYHFDAFLDHNMGFYIREIDSLLLKYKEIGVNFWLLHWTWQSPGSVDTKEFYSVVVYSPDSQIIYEFMTDDKPSDNVLEDNDIEVLESEMRATFAGFTPNYPWQPESEFYEYSIIPIRVSRAVSDLDHNVNFYSNILEARLVLQLDTIAELGGDNVNTRIGYMLNPGATVEVVFVERDSKYTQPIFIESDDIKAWIAADVITQEVEVDGDNNSDNNNDAETQIDAEINGAGDEINSMVEEEVVVEIEKEVNLIDAYIINKEIKEDEFYMAKYLNYGIAEWEADMNEEHEGVVQSEYCGFTRWFDNHYGYEIWAFDGMLDRVLSGLREEGSTFRVFKQVYDHTSEDAKEWLEKYDKETVYSIWLVEPNGQAIHLTGDFSDIKHEFTQSIPLWSPQWCYQTCNSDSTSSSSNKNNNSLSTATIIWVSVVAGLVLITLCFCFCLCKRRRNNNEKFDKYDRFDNIDNNIVKIRNEDSPINEANEFHPLIA